MSLVATIRALVAAGGTPEMILAVVEAHEDALAKRREKDAARQAKKRALSRDVRGLVDETSDTLPHVGAGVRVVVPFSSSLRSEEVGGGVVGRERVPETDDWPDGKASDHADLLVRAVDSPWLDPSKSPDLVTTRGRVAAWRRDGASWEHDVLPVVTGLCANRRSKIGTWKFFDPAICRSIAENRAALQIPEASALVRGQGPPRTIDEKSSASWDYAMARIAEDG